jgi:hypothetical protein
VNYQLCPKPIALMLKKHKDHAATDEKMGGVKRRRKASFQTGDKTSEREVLLVKPLMLNKKFVAKGAVAHSSGLSVDKKASSMKTSFGPPLVARTSLKKAYVAPAEKDVLGYISTHVVNMVDTLASEEETSPLN